MNKIFTVLIVGITGILLSACGSGGDGVITKDTLPIVTGWFNGQPVQYIQTEASDAGVATGQKVNYVPGLANAVTATSGVFATGQAVDDIYVFTNGVSAGPQANVLPSAPMPAGATNTSSAYTPLWRVSTVTWNVPANATTLTSEAAIFAARTAGTVTITQTGIIVNCSVVSSPTGGTLANVTIHSAVGTAGATVTFPTVTGWFNGRPVRYIQTEASDAGVAAGQGVNFVPGLANLTTVTNTVFPAGKAVDDIYVFTNGVAAGKQANVIPSAPIPAGASNTSPDYTPIWRVSTVTWTVPANARTLTSEAAIFAAQAAGQVTITQTGIIVNCPVIFSPQGGLLPNVTES